MKSRTARAPKRLSYIAALIATACTSDSTKIAPASETATVADTATDATAAALDRSPAASEFQDPPYEVTIERDHEVQVVETGVAAFEIRLQMIKRARTSIDVEYFIYNLDHSGRIFTQALFEKKRQNPNLKIRILLDSSIAVLKLKPHFVNEFTKRGIEVRYYNKKLAVQFISLQYRNHRKILLIDGDEALTGGRNIGDEYFDIHDKFNFRDRDIWIRGPVVDHMQRAFDGYWENERVEPVAAFKEPQRRDFPTIPGNGKGGPGPVNGEANYRSALATYKKKLQAAEFFAAPNAEDRAIRQEIARVGGPLLDDPESKGNCPRIHSISDEPGFDWMNNKRSPKRRVRNALAKEINLANSENLYIESPYFIAQGVGQKAIINATSHKNKIVILTNGLASTDAFYVAANFIPRVGLYTAEGAGEIYVYSGQAANDVAKVKGPDGRILARDAIWGLHAKTIIFNEQKFSVGTFNIDPRSANLNTEMVVICEGNRKLTRYVRRAIENRITKSEQINKPGAPVNPFKNTTFRQRLLFLLSVPLSTLAENLL